MADQASVRGGRPSFGVMGDGNGKGSPEGQVVGGIAEFANDIATLAELQAKLALIDLKESVEHALFPFAMLVAGLFFILGALPVALFGVAELLAAALKISTGWALLLTGISVVLVAVLVMAVAAMRFAHSFSSFRRSREELSRNLAWIRTVILYSGRGSPRRSV